MVKPDNPILNAPRKKPWNKRMAEGNARKLTPSEQELADQHKPAKAECCTLEGCACPPDTD